MRAVQMAGACLFFFLLPLWKSTSKMNTKTHSLIQATHFNIQRKHHLQFACYIYSYVNIMLPFWLVSSPFHPFHLFHWATKG